MSLAALRYADERAPLRSAGEGGLRQHMLQVQQRTTPTIAGLPGAVRAPTDQILEVLQGQVPYPMKRENSHPLP